MATAGQFGARPANHGGQVLSTFVEVFPESEVSAAPPHPATAIFVTTGAIAQVARIICYHKFIWQRQKLIGTLLGPTFAREAASQQLFHN